MTEKCSEQVVTASTTTDNSPPGGHMFQNFLLIWIDGSIDESKQDFQDTLVQLRSVVNDVNVFKSSDECVDFLSEVDDQKVFMIVTGTIGEQIVPLIHVMPQLHTIYIFCDNRLRHEQWSKLWVKVQGVYTQITSIFEALQEAVEQYNQDSIAVSFVAVSDRTSNQNLDQLDPSFMYTQIFKEILLEMEYDRQSIEKFSTYCRNANYGSLKDINRFEDEYDSHPAIWWYTCPSFIFSLLNHALRTLEADTIIHMGFFIHNLHRQIEQLHREQVDNYHGRSFIVYRGQSLLETGFNNLQKMKGGLMSFNNFLSTSKNREVSLGFARGALTSTDMVGILFQMAIDPSISSTPYAAIDGVSYFNTEEEVLFSMHTIFHIGEITKLDKNNRLYEVELTLTGDDDQQLLTLTTRIREEVKGSGWHRLGILLIKIGQFNKAEELYTVLLEQTCDEVGKATYYSQLGNIKWNQGDYEKAIWYYQKGLEIKGNTLCPNDPSFAISYNNIGLVYENMGEYSKALSFYEKTRKIFEKTLPPNHPSLATSYNNIGTAYVRMEECSKALSFYEKALEIYQITLPPNDPLLATSYNNIGGIYKNMAEYSKALSFYEKALEICQKTLPPNHPLLATSYNNIGLVYDKMGEYSKALSFYGKALEINQKALPSNHPDLASSYNNIGLVYDNMGKYSKALSFYEKALEIRQKTLPPNHPELATSYSNIGGVHLNMEEYSKALSFYEKDLQICEKTLPPNHPSLATSYNIIGRVYYNMGKYSKALLFYEKTRKIFEETLPPNHPSLATSYNNIGSLYCNMGENSKALSFYEKTRKIFEETLSPNHPSLATSYSNIGGLYVSMRENSKALSFYEKVLEIHEKTLPSNHPDLATSYNNIGTLNCNMGEYSKALSYFERALDIWQRSLPHNHPDTKDVRENIELVKRKL